MKLTSKEKAEAKKAFDNLATRLYDMCVLIVEASHTEMPEDMPEETRQATIKSLLDSTANAMAEGVETQLQSVINKLKENKDDKDSNS